MGVACIVEGKVVNSGGSVGFCPWLYCIFNGPMEHVRDLSGKASLVKVHTNVTPSKISAAVVYTILRIAKSS